MRIQYLNVQGILAAGFLMACSGANPASSLAHLEDARVSVPADSGIPDAQELPCGPGTMPGDGGVCVVQDTRDTSISGDTGILSDAESTPDALVAPDTSQTPDGTLPQDAIVDAGIPDTFLVDVAVSADSGIPDALLLSDAILPDAVLPPPDEPVWPRLAPGPCVVQFRLTQNPVDDFDLAFQYDEHENISIIDKIMVNRDRFVYHAAYTNTYEEDVLVQVASAAPFTSSFSAFEPAQTHALSYYEDTGLLETRSVTYDGRIGGYDLYYAYDANGNKIMEEKTETPNNRNMYTWLYLYDEENRLLRYEEQREGALLRWDTYTYSEDGLSGRVALTGYTEDQDGNLVETVAAYENLLFDENGRLLERAFEQNGTEVYLNSYTYDEAGNLLTNMRWSRTGELDEIYTTTDYDYSCWLPDAQ